MTACKDNLCQRLGAEIFVVRNAGISTIFTGFILTLKNILDRLYAGRCQLNHKITTPPPTAEYP